MCWSKRSSPDFSTVTTTSFTPTVSSAADNSPVYCQYPAEECSQNATNGYCNFHGQCCALDGTASYCACFDGYKGKFCDTQKLDPWVLESLEANATIGIAVGVIVFFILVLTAILVFFVVIHFKRKRKEDQKQRENVPPPPVDHNSNSKNSASCEEESETMLSV